MGEAFTALGWAPVLRYRVVPRPNQVRLFYCNLRVETDLEDEQLDLGLRISNKVNGQDISFNIHLLREWLHISAEATTYTPGRVLLLLISFQRLLGMRSGDSCSY